MGRVRRACSASTIGSARHRRTPAPSCGGRPVANVRSLAAGGGPRGQAGRPVHPSRPLLHGALVALLLAIVLAGPTSRASQQPVLPATGPAADTAPPALTAADIEARVAEVQATGGLSDDERAALLDTYEQARTHLTAAETRAANAREFDQQITTAGERIATLRQRLAQPPSEPQVSVDEPLNELEAKLAAVRVEHEAAQAQLATWEKEPARRSERQAELPQRIAAHRAEQQEIEQRLADPSPPGTTALAAQANRTLLRARLQAISADLEAMRAELRLFENTRELVPLEREWAGRKLADADERMKHLRVAVSDRRRREAVEQAEAARQQAELTLPSLNELAERNTELAEQRVALINRVRDAAQELEAANQRLSDLNRRFEAVKEKVRTVGLTATVGALLRKDRGELPDPSALRADARARARRLQDAREEWLRLTDERSALDRLAAEVERELTAQDFGERLPPDVDLEAEIRRLLEARREYLDQLIIDYDSYFSHLLELGVSHDQLLQVTQQFANFIDERVLWISSAKPLWQFDMAAAQAALAWLFNPVAWGRILEHFDPENLPHAAGLMAALLAIAPLAYLQRRLRGQIGQLGEQAAKSTAHQARFTFQALLYTLIVSAVWPVWLTLVSLELARALEHSDLVRALAAGLQAMATLLLPIEFLRQLCRSKGLGAAHFDWPRSSLRQLRIYLRQLLILLLPSALVVGIYQQQGNPIWADTVGRVAFVVGLAGLIYFVSTALRPRGPVLQETLAWYRTGWIARTAPLWYWSAVLLPTFLLALAIVGYYYTALQLTQRLFGTVWLVLFVVVINATLHRWLLMARRRMAMQQARERRAQQALAAESEGLPDEMAAIEIEEPRLDLAAINQQTRKLVRALLATGVLLGLWAIWSGVMPALGLFRGVPLWSTTVQVAETVTQPDGEVLERTRTQLRQITLADVGLALLLLTLTYVGATNLPGLLEVVALGRLPVDAGTRFAVTTIARYAITVSGVVAAFGLLGIGWSKVQWLVAAISVGLGFGLQEIFANFVSGLIILFERPIRVGDIVTVSQVSGAVSKIRIRATTITDWDRKELVIPNKEFITGQVINWTLSDTVNRVMVNIGVAYGSDTRLTTELLLKAAREQPHVVEDPPPRVLFEGFGDSALKFILYVHLPSFEHRLQTINSLNMRIDELFREAKIEIAFPQHDVHIRSIEAPLTLATDGRLAAAGQAATEAPPPSPRESQSEDVPPDPQQADKRQP